jgi:hypothetical protein
LRQSLKNVLLSVERNGKKKGESPGRVDLGKRKTKRHAATKAAKKVPRAAHFYQRCITAGSALFWELDLDPQSKKLDPYPN